MQQHSQLAGKRALVTGGSAGIGHAIAAALIQAGARVAIAARNADRLRVAAADLGAIPMEADLSSADAATRLAGQALQELGGLDVLVLSSGVYASGEILDLPEEALEQMLGPNLIGPAALARRLALALASTGGDILVVNSSVTRARNVRGRGHFAASQHALKALTDGLRDELNPRGVRVTSLFPGTTATPRQERIHGAAGKPYEPDRLLQPADVAAAAMAALSLPKTAEVTDLYIRPRLGDQGAPR